jgi:hypothetical protein
MIAVIPASPDALETWLVDADGHVAVSNEGLALLSNELSPGSGESGGAAEVLREG